MMGVKFYSGHHLLHPLMHVRLHRNCTNSNKDYDAVQVLTKSGIMLGHLERKVAGFVALVMDASLPGIVIKA